MVKLNGVPDIEYRRKTSNVFLDTLDEMISQDNPYTCPHGRPTTIKYSKEELEKMLEGK